jgi:ADP-ribosyl-[dinitrogen reductase] hydrolase
MENPTGYIVDTMIAVLQAFIDTDSFRDCLVDVVNRGGDADTTGAIAGMIAGAYYGLHAVPREWLAALDPRVRDACRDQALALMEMPGRQTGDGLEATPVTQEISI